MCTRLLLSSSVTPTGTPTPDATETLVLGVPMLFKGTLVDTSRRNIDLALPMDAMPTGVCGKGRALLRAAIGAGVKEINLGIQLLPR